MWELNVKGCIENYLFILFLMEGFNFEFMFLLRLYLLLKKVILLIDFYIVEY